MHSLDQICFRRGISYSFAEFEFLAENPRNFTLIVEASGHRLAGFAITELTRRGGAVVGGHIITIDVDPAYRRQGIGRMLMQALERELIARGARKCVLEVAVDNPAAQEFYSGLGYQTTARLRRYYLDRIDAMVMEKNLPVAGTRT